MERYTLKQLRSMVQHNAATELKSGKYKLPDGEKYISQIGYAAGIYGCTAKLFVGEVTKRLYVAFGQYIYVY